MRGPINLTDRQLQVLRLAALGRSQKTIAAELERHENTVRDHLKAACQALGVTTTTAAVAKAIILGKLRLDDDDWQT